MTIRIKNYKVLNSTRKVPKSRNPELLSLFKLYHKIAKNTGNTDIIKITRRLNMSRNNRHPVSLSAIIKNLEGKDGKIPVVVAKVLDDERMLEIPAIQLVCLQCSNTARAKVLKFGGEVYTLDQLFKVSPRLDNLELIQGDRTRRKVYKYFGAAGDKFSTTYPKAKNTGKNGETRLARNVKRAERKIVDE
ncbi:60S ribosomal protein L18 [Astathelohania contejeani]|uniref:60S ribosomal protein L18 n=1 Tax=Astathelohania contejeani TaxID=164912 RepID=A0ABQ7HZH3_9MICR|nr:60S ribosomal protein L18 [Thelohania contejeani]